MATKDRRYIYNGNTGGNAAPGGTRSNRKGVRRTASTFNIILLLFGLGGAVVFYINNILAINKLSVEIDVLRRRHEQIVDLNTKLRGEVTKKSSWDRIGTLAAANGLHPAQQQPEWITIDRNRIRELDALSFRRRSR
jgi:hypothetical protein